ncbi:MAG TPA: hypothetical protein VK875_01100 [Euzebyales bacterium]|nr:hypothetical protein [Euzebyales bacterium]
MSSEPRLLPAPAGNDSDETEGFLAAVTERLGSYVYLFIDPRDDRVFHVGTGAGDQCFRDLAEARTADGGTPGGATRDVVRGLEAAGHRVRIDILRHGLSPQTATMVASAVRQTLGFDDAAPTHDAVGADAGRMSVGDLNARYGAKPVAIDDPVVLIRVPRACRRGTDHQFYEMTRGWWRAGARRERAQWAFAVDDGVVRAVYRIEAWEPARAGNRWGFRGHRDAEMERRYLNADVSGYLLSDANSPLQYINC